MEYKRGKYRNQEDKLRIKKMKGRQKGSAMGERRPC